MEKIKKYFEFSNTISGMTYLLRNLLGYFAGFVGGYIVGYGLVNQIMGLTTLGFVITAPVLWFTFTTVYKRANALFPKDATLVTVGIIFAQVVSQLTQDSVGPILSLSLLIMGLILIFKNSGIANHEG